MGYSKLRFAAELILKLEEGYDVDEIARWAYDVDLEGLNEIDDDFNEIVDDVRSMCSECEIVYSEQELCDMALKLIESEKS